MIPAWEAAKENVIPLKAGRSVKGLSTQLSKGLSEQQFNKEEAEQEAAFESSVNDTSNATDPLTLMEHYIQYLKWTRNTYPSKNDKTLKLLERCTCALKDAAVLKNEARFVKLWIEYADMVRTPGEVFSFMQANKIGERVSLFWIAWAFVAEKAENFKLTDQIFQKGIRRLAEPKEQLSLRYRQFQRRMARHYLNMTDAEVDFKDIQLTNNSVAATSGSSNTNTDGQSQRKALGQLSSSQASGRVASRVTEPSSSSSLTQAPPRQHSSSNHRNNATDTTASVRSKHPSITSNSSNQGLGFAIFSDENAMTTAATSSNNSNSDGSAWRVLGTEEERRKENEVPTSRWTDAGLSSSSRPQERSHPREPVIAAAAILPAPAFAIFSDPVIETTSTEICTSQSSVSADTLQKQQQQRPGLSVRRQLDSADGADKQRCQPSDHNDALAAIMKHPIARHQIQTHQQSTSTSTSTSNDLKATTSAIATVDTVTAAAKSATKRAALASRPALSTPSAPTTIKAPHTATTTTITATTATTTTKNNKQHIEEEQQINEQLLRDLALLDDEDGTINTKIARRDIDSMFCSPVNDHNSTNNATASHKPFNTAARTQKANETFTIFEDYGASGNTHTTTKTDRKVSKQPRVRVEELSAFKDLSAIKNTSGCGDISVFSGVGSPAQEHQRATQKRKRLYCPFPLSASFASVNTAIDICTAQPAESNVCSESQTYEEQQSQHRIVESCAPVSALPVESSLAAVSTTAFELFKPNFVSLMIDFLRQQCVGQHKFESTHSSHTMPTLQVLDLTTAKTPACFHFHNKKVCSTTVQLSGGASDTLELNDIKNIGRGTQAFAISTTVSCSGGSTGVESAFKCDSKSVAVVFECFVHQVLQARLNATDHNLLREYHQCTLPPRRLLVYRDCAVMEMRFAKLKTLVASISLLHASSDRYSLSSGDKEFLTAYILHEMLRAIRLLHSVGLAHCDVKTDNWVLDTVANIETSTGTSSPAILGVHLIDFGKAKSVLRSTLGELKSSDFSRLFPIAVEDTVLQTYVGNDFATGYLYEEAKQLHVRREDDIVPQQQAWTFQPDYYGLCACLHQLLYGVELSVTKIDTIDHSSVIEECTWRGFQPTSIEAKRAIVSRIASRAPVVLPQQTLKRYWNREAWSDIFIVLLNPTSEATVVSGDNDAAAAQEVCRQSARVLQRLMQQLANTFEIDYSSARNTALLSKLAAKLGAR